VNLILHLRKYPDALETQKSNRSTMVPMNVATLAAALIASWEGCRLTAYQDSGGVWTIGFGHTAGVEPGDTCTPEQAAQWLAVDATPLLALVADEPLVSGAAHVSFGYNCGRGALELVITGKATLAHFVHDAHGNVLDGLVRRRAAEQALIYSAAPVSAQASAVVAG
jgi:lysozyme